MIRLIDSTNKTHYVRLEDVLHVEIGEEEKHEDGARYGYVQLNFDGNPFIYLNKDGAKLIEEQLSS